MPSSKSAVVRVDQGLLERLRQTMSDYIEYFLAFNAPDTEEEFKLTPSELRAVRRAFGFTLARDRQLVEFVLEQGHERMKETVDDSLAHVARFLHMAPAQDRDLVMDLMDGSTRERVAQFLPDLEEEE